MLLYVIEKCIFFLSSVEAMGSGVTKTTDFNKRYDRGKTLILALNLAIHCKKNPVKKSYFLLYRNKP